MFGSNPKRRSLFLKRIELGSPLCFFLGVPQPTQQTQIKSKRMAPPPPPSRASSKIVQSRPKKVATAATDGGEDGGSEGSSTNGSSGIPTGWLDDGSENAPGGAGLGGLRRTGGRAGGTWGAKDGASAGAATGGGASGGWTNTGLVTVIEGAGAGTIVIDGGSTGGGPRGGKTGG
jgi:hypothetical protein